MKLYTVKLRMFPPRRDLEDWFDEAPTSWEWGDPDEGEVIGTVYGRPIRDEEGRPGVSVKLEVLAYDECSQEPEDWNWEAVTGFPAQDFEFLRAVMVRELKDNEILRCYNCEKMIHDKPWTDGDGSGYCSSECIDNYVGNDTYRVSPDGTVINNN